MTEPEQHEMPFIEKRTRRARLRRGRAGRGRVTMRPTPDRADVVAMLATLGERPAEAVGERIQRLLLGRGRTDEILEGNAGHG